MAGIGIITNPHSKLNKRNPQRQHLLSYIAGESGHFKVTNNLEELKQVAADFCRREIHILAINGGDGTISKTLTAFIECYQENQRPLPKVALLRGGTINVLAENLGIRGTPEQILYRLIEAHSGGEPFAERTLSTLKVADNYGFLFASGTCARFLDEFYQNKTGPVGSVWLFLKVAASSLVQGELFHKIVRQERIDYAMDEQAWVEHQSLAVFCSTLEYMPFKFKLFPEAASDADKMQIVSVVTQSKDIVRRLWGSFFLHPERSDADKLRLKAHKLQLRGDGVQDFTLDGELFQSPETEIQVTLGPQIQFVIL